MRLVEHAARVGGSAWIHLRADVAVAPARGAVQREEPLGTRAADLPVYAP